MKKLLFVLLLVATASWSADYSKMSTEELLELRGTLPPSERPAFRAEMQKRMKALTPQERRELMRKSKKTIQNSKTVQKKSSRRKSIFSKFDLNSDGKITKSEWKKARELRRSKMASQGRMLRNSKNAPKFESVDTNGDGFISKKEFAAHRAARIRAIKNATAKQ